MEDKLKAITNTICAACYNVGCVMHDCSDCIAPAKAIYLEHIKPLEDALAKAEEREKVMVEALEWCVDIIEENKKFSMDSAEDAVKQARAVLASVKREVSPDQPIENFFPQKPIIRVKTINAIRAIGIATVGDLLEKSEEDLILAKKCGVKVVAFIKESLAEQGLELAHVKGEIC